MKTNTTRFSDRVDDYIKYRPHYPSQLLKVLEDNIGFNKKMLAADIGSGTGISSEIFINNGNKVLAVEPNKEMREAAETIYKDDANFISINGTASNSNIDAYRIDLIFCGQAFHWFDRNKAKKEFTRILKPDGHIVLAWNKRNEEDGFQKEYEQMLISNILEYQKVSHKNISDKIIADFFDPNPVSIDSIKNSQMFDLSDLKGRLLSSSYCPKEGSELDRLFTKLEDLYHKYEKGGIVEFEYKTKLYYY